MMLHNTASRTQILQMESFSFRRQSRFRYIIPFRRPALHTGGWVGEGVGGEELKVAETEGRSVRRELYGGSLKGERAREVSREVAKE